MMVKNLKFVVLFVFIITALFVSGCVNNDEDDDNDIDLNNNEDNNDNDIDNDNNDVDNSMLDFNQCLADNGVVIYGSAWCPACSALVESLGGSDAVEPVYVECTEEQERCAEEAKAGYVPEIQFDGELYEESRSVTALADLTGCEVPN